MLRFAVKGRVATKHSERRGPYKYGERRGQYMYGERRGWYTDGLLHSVDDNPALITFVDYFDGMVFEFPFLDEDEDEDDVVLYWFDRGRLHRGQGRPAVVFPHTTDCYNGGIKRAKINALWFEAGIMHTSPIVVSQMLAGKNKFVKLTGSNSMVWKGAYAYPDTLGCKQEQASWVHIKECVERMHVRCRCWSEFSARDTVRYDKYGRIHCSGSPVVRNGVEEWWSEGDRESDRKTTFDDDE
jgi:hypothetical protein